MVESAGTPVVSAPADETPRPVRVVLHGDIREFLARAILKAPAALLESEDAKLVSSLLEDGIGLTVFVSEDAVDEVDDVEFLTIRRPRS